MLLITRLRGISWRENLGLGAPGGRALIGWLGVWVLWIAAGEVVIRTLGLEQAEPWPAYPPLIVALRILAIGLIGPFSEEILMRGILFDRLRRTAMGPVGAILVLAVAWAAMHYRYGPGTLVLIALDGVVLGFARHRGGSLWIPVAMHMLGNLVSIGQSLAG